MAEKPVGVCVGHVLQIVDDEIKIKQIHMDQVPKTVRAQRNQTVFAVL